MGLGKRSDFTQRPQVAYDPGFIYNQNFDTIQTRLSQMASKGNAPTTFGSPHSRYNKVMIPGTKEHYMGKGPGHYVSNDGHDLKLLKKQKGGL